MRYIDEKESLAFTGAHSPTTDKDRQLLSELLEC